MNVLQLVILCLTGKVVFGLGSGAPSQSCISMLPGHKRSGGFPLISRQLLSRISYKVNAEIDGRYVRLSISGLRGSETVAGFLIQARLSEKGPAIGKFHLPDKSKDSIAQYQNCQDKKFPESSSITHTNPSPKPLNLTFLWSPIANRTQNITVKFYATLAKNHDIFWVKAPSNEINILDLSDPNGTPGRPSIPFWTLSSLVVTFMINLLIH